MKISTTARIQYSTHEIKIYTSNIEEFNKMKENFFKHNIQCYTYTPKEERTSKFVVKAAPFYDPQQIIDHINQDTKIIQDCIKLKPKNPKNERTACSYLCTVNKGTQIKHMKKFTEIDNTKLTWQVYARKFRRTQCHRCQEFGHGSINCNLTPRCVKCPGKHLTADCHIKERTEGGVQCCNCGGPHTANFSGCPIYLEYLQQQNVSKHSMTNKLTNSTNTNNVNKNPSLSLTVSNNNLLRENVNFATAVKGITNNNPVLPTTINNNETSTFVELVNEIRNLNQICDLKLLLTIAKELNAKLINCPDNISKIMTLQSIVNKYEP